MHIAFGFPGVGMERAWKHDFGRVIHAVDDRREIP